MDLMRSGVGDYGLPPTLESRLVEGFLTLLLVRVFKATIPQWINALTARVAAVMVQQILTPRIAQKLRSVSRIGITPGSTLVGNRTCGSMPGKLEKNTCHRLQSCAHFCHWPGQPGIG